MANNMRTTLLQAGTAEGLPLEKKARYIAPDITTVEFTVEVGATFSVKGVTRNNDETQFVAADPVTNGSETYSDYGAISWTN